MMLAVLQLVLALLHTTTIATTTATSAVAATTSLIFPGQHHKIASSVRCIDNDCTQARSDANRCMTNTNTSLDTAHLPSSSPIIIPSPLTISDINRSFNQHHQTPTSTCTPFSSASSFSASWDTTTPAQSADIFNLCTTTAATTVENTLLLESLTVKSSPSLQHFHARQPTDFTLHLLNNWKSVMAKGASS